MSSLSIRGGRPLEGVVEIGGSKNSALAIITAAGLAEGTSVIENVPRDTDVLVLCQILRNLGVDVWFDDAERLHVDGTNLRMYKAPYDLVRKMRASFYVAGLLLARLGRAEVPLPGGCAIGSRPVDYHLRGFEQLGATVGMEHGYVTLRSDALAGTKIYVNRSSVGTTVNLLLAASLAEGQTVLENAAKEPEIVDLSIFLNSIGAKIRGAGTDVIKIEGATRLHGTEYGIIPDRIEAGTYMVAGAASGGRISLRNVMGEHVRSSVLKLQEAGVNIEVRDTEIVIDGRGRPRAVDVETHAYPGFPTDLQQPFVALMSLAEGTSVVRETIFDRFQYVDELRRLGADIKVERDTAIIRGVPALSGAPVEATDLRGGAAMVVAGLAASGETTISGLEIIDRGYEDLAAKLSALGADVVRHDDADAGVTDEYESLRAMLHS